MAIETEIVVAAQDALPRFTSQASAGGTAAQAGAQPEGQAAPEEGVTLTLSAQGRLMAALADVVDMAATSASATAAVAEAAAAAPAPLPVTRAELYAIEARLVAARSGADAIARADREPAPSDDPARVRQAAQATASLYGRAPNPFAGLSRAELSAIVYDESGAYTVNERYAAANQRTELDRNFWAPVLQRALASGDWRPVIEAGLAFYASLSPLERTAYPPNYVQLMQQYLALEAVEPVAPLPPAQQADLVRMLASLVLPSGPLALAGGSISGLSSPRFSWAAGDLLAAAPRLADILPLSAIVQGAQEEAYLVLLQRVFGISRREDEPAVASRAGVSVAARDFLSYGDRRYLAQAYAYSAATGIAPEQVDALARDLSRYRAMRAVRTMRMAGGENGQTQAGPLASTPQQGRMSAGDTALAQRMLASRAARDTRLDHAFLAWLLDPRGGGWSSDGESGHAVSFSMLEKLLAGLAGVAADERAGDAAALESDYRYALQRIARQDDPASYAMAPAGGDPGMRTTLPAAQLAALARSEAAELAFMDNALMLLRMYRYALRMSDAEQRTLSELVYASLRKRRQRARRGKLFVAWAERSPLMPPLAG
jgi:hypothetical protein